MAGYLLRLQRRGGCGPRDLPALAPFPAARDLQQKGKRAGWCWVLTEKHMKKTERTSDGHLLWRGALANGYPAIKQGDCTVYLRRVVWEESQGPVPVGAIVIALCGERTCIEPGHLALATPGRYPQPLPSTIQEWCSFPSTKRTAPSSNRCPSLRPPVVVHRSSESNMLPPDADRRSRHRASRRSLAASASAAWSSPSF